VHLRHYATQQKHCARMPLLKSYRPIDRDEG